MHFCPVGLNKDIVKALDKAHIPVVLLASVPARSNIADGTRLFAVAERPTKADS